MTDKPIGMIIEDDPQQSEIFSYAIQQAGYVVVTCADGEAALELLEAKEPYLVVLDLNLPNVSGDKILKFIRSHSNLAETKVILATANPRQT